MMLIPPVRSPVAELGTGLVAVADGFALAISVEGR
jgi:hypothetical protein